MHYSCCKESLHHLSVYGERGGRTSTILDNLDKKVYKFDEFLEVLEYIAKQPTPVNLQYVMKYVLKVKGTNRDREYNRVYMRLYRLLRSLEELGAVELFKRDGLIWIKPKPPLLDLMFYKKNSNRVKPCGVSCENRKTGVKLPRRCSFERFQAIRVALSVKMLSDEDRKRIRGYFDDYVYSRSSLRVVVRRKPDAPSYFPEFIVLPYRTRFTDRRYVKRLWRVLNEIFRVANERYKEAVFLTLTTDPKRFGSLYESWRHFSIAFNRFMSYLSKRLGERPVYVAFYEFTKSGLLHVHVIVFGRVFLLPKDTITRVWSRCGQGEVNYVVALRNFGGRWRGGDISNLKGYLAKYLSKVLRAVESSVNGFSIGPFGNRKKDDDDDYSGLELYFASGKRFMSWSYRLFKPCGRVYLGFYYFFVSCSELDIPLVVVESSHYFCFDDDYCLFFT